MKQPRLWFIASVIVLAVVVRLIPHPFNFTPVGAAALFAGATLERKWLAFLVPLTAMLMSDAVIGFHSAMPVVYGCFAAAVCVGFVLRGRTRSPFALLGAAVASGHAFLRRHQLLGLDDQHHPLPAHAQRTGHLFRRRHSVLQKPARG